MSEDEPLAHVVLRGEDESTSIVLYPSDVVRLKRCLEYVPVFSPSDQAEQDSLNERLFRLVGPVHTR